MTKSWIWGIFVALFSIITIPKTATAQEFAMDLYWLKNAVIQSDGSLNMDSYLNPYVGLNNYTLSRQRAPWAANYFPMKDGGLANRWQVKDQKALSGIEDVNKLSPIEKYDIWVGNQNYQATNFELSHRGPLRAKAPADWEGFCNGVRCAGLILPEPKKNITVSLPDGTKMDFTPADLKALAGASYFYIEHYSAIGSRTERGKRQSQPNAAVFDLALRYYLAKLKQGFVIDTHLGTEVWNETVVGYDRQISEALELTPEETIKYPEAHQKHRVTVDLVVLGEISIEESNNKTTGDVAARKNTDIIPIAYTLYTDVNGNVVDGNWKKPKGLRGVDFAWFARGRGTDAENADKGGNPFLAFDHIESLFRRSVPLSCNRVHQR